MEENRLLNISQFAKLSGIKRKNLIFYDEIGLFHPAHVGENGYRYYTYRQFDTANLIWCLKEMGMPLKEIREYTAQRTPARMLALFGRQRKQLEQEIYKLRQIQSMMRVYMASTRECLKAPLHSVALARQKAEDIALGPVIDYSGGKTVTDATGEFYDYAAGAGFVCSYPLGALVGREEALQSGGRRPRQFYFRMPGGKGKKPAGLYATAYGKGDYGQTGPLYALMLAYLAENGLALDGDVYEEYLLDEISTKQPEEYMFRLSMPVRSLA